MRMLAIALIACACSVASADEPWNQYRGPRGDGTSTVKGLPVQFGEGSKEIVWKIPMPGRAWSSPVAWGKQIWITNAPEIQNTTPEKPKLDKPLVLSAVCIDFDTGKTVHDIKLFEVDTPQFTHPTNSYGSPTPYVEKGRVYVHFGTYGTACLDTETGKTIWKRDDLHCNHFRGPGSSVAVYGDLVYLTMDGYDTQYIVALNKKTGETAWKKDRAFDFGNIDGDAKKAYSTPTLVEFGGRSMLISPFAMATIAYDPKTGEELWTVRHGGMNAAARPLFGNGMVYINSADGPSPLIALRPKGTGDLTSEIVWKSSKAIPKRSSQLLIGDLLFMMNDSGIASCLDANTGDVLWTERLGSDYWSSPIYADGLIYCFSQKGNAPVLRAAREYELVADNMLGEGCNASPAVVEKSLIVRTLQHVYRIEKK